MYTAGQNAPKRVDAPESPDKAAWLAEHLAAKQRDAERKAAAAMKARPDDFEKALRPLRDLVAATRDHSVRAALIARITTELWR